jgi:lysophospholipid acyltransferase (LPLAT)-like uncharacterized protein
VLGPAFLRLWFGMVKTRWIFPGFGDRETVELTNRIFTIWHQHFPLFIKSHRNSGARILVSGHGDGQLFAGVARRLGLGIVSGSSTRGGAQAVKTLLELSDEGPGFVISPDGPRGPRHKFQLGAVYFASRSGLPLVAVHAEYDRFWQLGTWDGLMIPKPFSRCVVTLHEGFTLPPDLDRDAQKEWCRKMEAVHETLARASRENFEELYAQGISESEVASLWSRSSPKSD